MQGLVPGLVILGLVALAAARLSLSRHSPERLSAKRLPASHALTLAIVVQVMHFAEEWLTGFHVKFPALFELPPMPLSLFAGFNLIWIAIWIASVPAIRTAKKPAFFAAWFLAIAGVLNGIAHPAMAIAAGGYFPGLVSSPFMGVAGLVLCIRLARATSGRAADANQTGS